MTTAKKETSREAVPAERSDKPALLKREEGAPLIDFVLSGKLSLPRGRKAQKPFLRKLQRAACSRQFRETIRDFRDSVIRSTVREKKESKGGLTIAVAGVKGGEGASFLSLLLAFSLGASRHHRVAHLDGRFNVQRFDALADVLSLAEESQTTEMGPREIVAYFNAAQPNVSFLKNQFPEPSLDFFSSKKAVAFWSTLRENFDFTVIDMPPILGGSANVYVAPNVDRLYLAVMAGKTRLVDVDHCVHNVEEARAEISGVIITQQDLPLGARLFWKEYFF
ncbi:MAG: hypothetical protein JXA90_01150 [Planctomycetes bacterium]|nr:hypothetical protein [Planctomycetota bacterium]